MPRHAPNSGTPKPMSAQARSQRPHPNAQESAVRIVPPLPVPPPAPPRQPIHGGRRKLSLPGWMAFCQSPVNQLFSPRANALTTHSPYYVSQRAVRPALARGDSACAMEFRAGVAVPGIGEVGEWGCIPCQFGELCRWGGFCGYVWSCGSAFLFFYSYYYYYASVFVILFNFGARKFYTAT